MRFFLLFLSLVFLYPSRTFAVHHPPIPSGKLKSPAQLKEITWLHLDDDALKFMSDHKMPALVYFYDSTDSTFQFSQKIDPLLDKSKKVKKLGVFFACFEVEIGDTSIRRASLNTKDMFTSRFPKISVPKHSSLMFLDFKGNVVEHLTEAISEKEFIRLLQKVRIANIKIKSM